MNGYGSYVHTCSRLHLSCDLDMGTGNPIPGLQKGAHELSSMSPRSNIENHNSLIPDFAEEASSPPQMSETTAPNSKEHPDSVPPGINADKKDTVHQGPRFVARDGEIDGLGSPCNQTKVE